MRVGVTGAQGFTGRYVVEALEQRGHEAVPLAADITDAAAIRDEVAATAPEAVIHLAAVAFVASGDFAAFYQVNQIGTFNLLAAVADTCPGATVLLASSAQVYGDQASGLIDEEHPLRPANHYGLSKTAMEMGAAFWSGRLRLIVARPFNYTGRGQEERYLLPKIVAHFRRRDPVIELGNLNVRRDFGDVRAVAAAYCELLFAEDPRGPFNIATQRLFSVREIVDIASAHTGHSIEMVTNPAFVRPDDVPVLGGSNQRLRDALPSWRPNTVEETLRWMLDEPAAPA